MIKFNAIWLIALIGYVVSFVGMITFSYLSRDKNDSFSFRNHFPFELIKGKTANVFTFVFAAFSFASLFVTIPLFGEFGDMAIFNIFMSFLMGIVGLVTISVIRISTAYLSSHLKLATLFMTLAFFVSILDALHFFLTYSTMVKFPSASPVHLILGIFSSLLAILMLIVILNPKLKNWAQLEEHISGDNKTFERPKNLSLAYSEWISLGVIALAMVLYLLSLLEI